ncbi:hypothetical protein EOM39_07055 [Candidatus Gracilibacteria bacterium]|nr:hypothetical protein [Candidatus Gracilibacteria bacterium]
MAETLIKNFTEISKADTKIAGGKGASLGEMTQAGISVPEGFVILSNAFDRFIEETDLNVEIDAVLDEVDIKKVHTVENASEKIQAMILSKEMPEDIKTEILKFYKNLDCKFVAVRSSATSEDSASAAWAGQLDSFLNTTNETLLENVKKCWSSLFTPRAIFYRFEKKLNNDKIAVAVVVQKMVDSKESGIAFSVHPVTQDENQIIIEAGFGLGEAIVSGSITPDSYVIDKQGFNILDINVNEQTKALYKKDKGGNEWKELGEKGKKQVLAEKEIIELSKLIVKIENHYRFPCDIEWAKEKGKIYIVQSRPITTLNKNMVFSHSWSKLLTRKNSIFMDYIKLYGASNKFIDLGWDYTIKNFKVVNGINYIAEDYPGYIKSLENHTKKDNKILNKIVRSAYKNIKSFKDVWGKIYQLDTDNLLDSELRILYRKYLKTIFKLMAYLFPPLYAENILTKKISYIISRKSDKPREDLLSIITIPKKRSLVQQENIDYYTLLKKSEDEDKNIKKHLSKWAWLGDHNFFGDFWTFEDIRKRITSENEDAEKMLNKIITTEGELEKKSKLEIKKLNLSKEEIDLIHLIKEYVYLRTFRLDMLFYSEFKVKNLLDQIAFRMGLKYEEFVLLTHNEIDNWFDKKINYKQEIDKRKRNYAIVLEDSKLRLISGDEVKSFEEFDEDSTAETIKGSIAFKGLVRGRAKIILHKNEFNKFKNGDVLITAMTTPDYVPLMKKASAIITDEGGITCHAAIISRELNIPCIIGTKLATQILKDNYFLEVNANKGIVKILKKKK